MLRGRLRALALLPLFAALAACDTVTMSPAGDVALQQRDIIVASMLLMLLIIIPVIALTILFAWRYRASAKHSTYDPEWHHSTQLELVIWAAPLVIIIALGAITWVGTHVLDPYRPLPRIAAGRPIPAGVRPLEVEVVALDWKWLFIYPEYGIATVNEMAAPVDRPIAFKLTASSVMNAFNIPALAGMVYAMPGMETKLHMVANKPGTFRGFASNYNGAGFSDMHFQFHGMSQGDFDGWVATVKRSRERPLDAPTYLALARPSESEKIHHFPVVDAKLYPRILNMCVEAGRACMADTMNMAGGQHRMGPVPVNNGAQPQGGGDQHGGALQRSQDPGHVAPHEFAPEGQPTGSRKPGDIRNRTFSFLDMPHTPAGALAPSRG